MPHKPIDPSVLQQVSLIKDLKKKLKKASDGTTLTPRGFAWINILFPLLDCYNFSHSDVLNLVKKCDYDSDLIQDAVSAILEQKVGHELGQWTQVTKPKKKTKPDPAELKNRSAQNSLKNKRGQNSTWRGGSNRGASNPEKQAPKQYSTRGNKSRNGAPRSGKPYEGNNVDSSFPEDTNVEINKVETNVSTPENPTEQPSSTVVDKPVEPEKSQSKPGKFEFTWASRLVESKNEVPKIKPQPKLVLETPIEEISKPATPVIIAIPIEPVIIEKKISIPVQINPTEISTTQIFTQNAPDLSISINYSAVITEVKLPPVTVSKPELEEPVVMPRYPIEDFNCRGLLFGSVGIDSENVNLMPIQPSNITQHLSSTAIYAGNPEPTLSSHRKTESNEVINNNKSISRTVVPVSSEPEIYNQKTTHPSLNYQTRQKVSPVGLGISCSIVDGVGEDLRAYIAQDDSHSSIPASHDLVDDPSASFSKQLINPPVNSMHPNAQPYCSVSQRRKSEQNSNCSNASQIKYSNGAVVQGYSVQSPLSSVCRNNGVNPSINRNLPAQKSAYTNNINTQSPYQSTNVSSSKEKSTNHSSQTNNSPWYDQSNRSTQTSFPENSSNPQLSKGISNNPVASHTSTQNQSASSAQQSRPPPPLSTSDAQNQTLIQQPSANKNKINQSTATGQSQPSQHHNIIGHMPQHNNMYTTHPHSAAPPGLTPSGAPPGIHSQHAFNYGYPNLGYPQYNMPAYSAGYGQPMMPQYGMIGAPFSNKGAPGMHGGYPNHYNMGYAEGNFEDLSSLHYPNSTNNTEVLSLYGASSGTDNQFQTNPQSSHSNPSNDSTSNNTHSSGSNMMQSNSQNFSNVAIANGTSASSYSSSGVYNHSYSQNNSAPSNGNVFSSSGQNIPPGFVSGYSSTQKESRSTDGFMGGSSSLSNSGISNGAGYFMTAANQSNSNFGTSGVNNGSTRSNNSWENYGNQNPSQHQYIPSNFSTNQGSGYGQQYSRGRKSTYTSGQYNSNYANRNSSLSNNNQTTDGNQGYYNYDAYSQPNSNIQSQYSTQNPPGLGENYYGGQQFQQHY